MIKEIVTLKETGDLMLVTVSEGSFFWKKLHIIVNPAMLDSYENVMMLDIIESIKKNKARYVYIEPIRKTLFNKIVKEMKRINITANIKGDWW